MLSKSQARLFFLLTTFGFSVVFLVLTVDTIRQTGNRSHADTMNEQVLLGRRLWDQNNCMGCHTLLGEGAYYAPELTKVVERRGKEWLKLFLKDPQAMFPGERKMVQYNFTAEEIDGVIAFLDWIGQFDTNGFPADPPYKATPVPVTTAAAASLPVKFTTVCVACHAVGGSGGAVGPALDGVGQRISEADLDRWLADPAAVKPGTTMPNLNLSDSERGELVRWLVTLR